MRVLLSAFACRPGYGSEPGNGWHWVGALSDLGHEVTVLTVPDYRKELLKRCPQGVHFHFIDIPASRASRFSKLFGRRVWIYDFYGRWQDAAVRHVEAQAQRYDVAHHVTYGGLHLGSMLWRLPIPLVYGPVGGGHVSSCDTQSARIAILRAHCVMWCALSYLRGDNSGTVIEKINYTSYLKLSTVD